MKSQWIAAGWVFLIAFFTPCICTHAEDGNRFFPAIDYDNQSPYGTHEVSISHKDITNEHVETYNAIVGVVSRRILKQLSNTSIRRDLGDFDDLNDLLKGVTISLPDIDRIDAGQVLFSRIFIWARDIVCFDLSLEDIEIDHSMINKQNYDFSLDIKDLAISCDLKWRYEYSFFSGEGTAQVYTTKSDASISLRFESSNFDLHPPSSVNAQDCATSIEIDDLDIQGGIVASIVSLFEGALVNAIEDAINDVACEELNSIAEDLLSSVIENVAEFLEQFLPDNSPPVDFLFPENNMTVPPGMEILDFSSLGSESGNWFEYLIELVDEVLGVTPDGTDFNINKLLRDTILDQDHILAIPLSVVIFDGHDMLTETIIELTHVRVIGLDTINRFDSLDLAGNHTLFNHFSWEHIDVEMDFDLTIKPSSQDGSIIDGPGDVVEEQMTITAGIDEIDVDFHLLLALNKGKIGSTALGSITDINNIFSCALDTIHHVEVAGFAVAAKAIDIPTLSGFISPGIDRVMTNTADAVFNMYEPVLIQAIPNIFQLAVKGLLNDLLQDSLDSFNITCPTITFPSNETFINLGDLLLNETDAMAVGGTGTSPYGHIISDAMVLVKNELLKIEPDGRSVLNEMLIAKITENQSGEAGTLNLPVDIGVATTIVIGELTANLEFKLSNATIDHLDSIGVPLDLLTPVTPQTLNNTMGFGVGSDALTGSVIVTIGFSDGDAIGLRNVLEVSLSLRGVVDAAVQTLIIENSLMSFPLEDMLNLNCWLSLMLPPALDSNGVIIPAPEPSLALKNLALIMSNLNLNVTCIDCSSPLLEELASILSSESAVGELTDVLHDILDYITNLLGGTFLQNQIDRLLIQAPLKCPHSTSYRDDVQIGSNSLQKASFPYQKQPSDPLTLVFVVAGVVGGTIGMVFIIYTIVQIVKRRRQSIYINTLSEREIRSILARQQHEVEGMRRLNDETTAMFLSPSIPILARVLVPLVVIANIGFFLSGHLSLGASVDFDVKIAGEAFRIEQLFIFSMAESVMDMWDSGAKELAIMILLFSGLWPYTKQLAVLVLWFTPPRMVSVNRRESIFVWLDRLGKWSFVDIFVLILSLSSFRVIIKSPDTLAYIPKSFIDLNMLVIPCWGLYSNMIAQLISQVNSHFVIHYHRKLQFDHEKKIKIEEMHKEIEDRTPLYKHSFQNMFVDTTLYLRPITSVVVTFLAILFACLIISGCMIPSYSLEQFGIVGLTSSEPFVKHDIFSTVQLLADQASFTGKFSDRLGLTVLSSVLILTVLVVPIVQLALSLYRWFRPMSKKTRLRFFVAIEALASWQYIEVYLLSITVASWQLGGVSEFLINDFCGGLEDTFAMLQYYGILGVNEAQCFRVSARLEPATWILITASIVFTLFNHIINSAAKQQEEDIKMIDSSYNTIELVRPAGVTDESQDIQEEQRFSGLRLLEPIRFNDFYPCFLKRSPNKSIDEINNEPRSPSTSTLLSPASPDLHEVFSNEVMSPVPFKEVELDEAVSPVPFKEVDLDEEIKPIPFENNSSRDDARC